MRETFRVGKLVGYKTLQLAVIIGLKDQLGYTPHFCKAVGITLNLAGQVDDEDAISRGFESGRKERHRPLQFNFGFLALGDITGY